MFKILEHLPYILYVAHHSCLLHLSFDIQMLNIIYLASKLLYGFASVQAIIHSLKLMDYLPVQKHKPYNNFCLPDRDRSGWSP